MVSSHGIEISGSNPDIGLNLDISCGGGGVVRVVNVVGDVGIVVDHGS